MTNTEKIKELYKDFKTMDENEKDYFVLWLLQEYETYLDTKEQISHIYCLINY